MSCEDQQANGESDSLELTTAVRPLDRSASAWLLGQAVRYLNAEGEAAEFEYGRVVEVLGRCSDDLLDTVVGIFRQVAGGDTTLRWNLLYVLGDAGDVRAARFLAAEALKPLPDKTQGECCESERDMEMLVATGAVHALQRVAARHPEAADHVLEIIEARPEQPILIEAVKVAADLDLGAKVKEILPEDDRWILDIRRIKVQELFAEPEREDGTERGFTPPRSGSLYTAPKVICCNQREA